MTAISNSSTDSLIEPKDRETRVVYLTPHARAVLNEWTAIVGVQNEGPPGSDDVFCNGASPRRW